MEYETSISGKVLRAGGTDDPRYRVLCLPGGLCTAAFYDDLLAAPALAAGGVRAFATTRPDPRSRHAHDLAADDPPPF